MKIIQILFIIFITYSFQSVYAQKTFDVTVQFDQSFDHGRILWVCDDGETRISGVDTTNDRKLQITGKLYSKFATLDFTYYDSNSSMSSSAFFVDEQPAKISFKQSTDTTSGAALNQYEIVNAIAIYKEALDSEIMQFSKKEMHAVGDFYSKPGNGINPNQRDSVSEYGRRLYKALNIRNMEFIKQHATAYYSFWYFKTQVVATTVTLFVNDLPFIKQVLDFFDTTFSYADRTSAEGKLIRQRILGHLNARVGIKAPDFETKDIKGALISIDKFKGKYVLVDFWATWCQPCVAEIPFIKSIRDKYAEDKLVMISISEDTDSTKFNAAIRKYDMNWIHIYGNKKLPVLYGLQAIPTTFLIDREGKIVYNNYEENNTHESLLKLLDNQ